MFLASQFANSIGGLQFAIRHTVRAHTILKSDVFIKEMAALVDPRHKVKLSKPDKVILVEIFQVSGSDTIRTHYWSFIRLVCRFVWTIWARLSSNVKSLFLG